MNKAPAAARRDGHRRRWPIYLAAGVGLILVLAYIDGGEEPIRPIIQTVVLQS